MVTHDSEGVVFLDHWHHDLKNALLLKALIDEIAKKDHLPRAMLPAAIF